MEKVTQMIGFTVATGNFALPIAAVREIVRVPAITPLPHVAAEVEGVMNLRGRVLPVVSMRRYLKLSNDAGQPTRPERIIVVELGARLVGLRVDGDAEVLHCASAAEPCGERFQGFSQGQVKVDGRAVVVLDLKRLLDRVGARA
jgi:purine-binding chemotaxis protein CheW